MNDSRQDHFYVVSMRKFTVLFIGTVGLYGIYWFYRMFKTMEVVSNRNLFPIIRALLNFLFVLGLFNFIHKQELKRDPERRWRPDFLAWVFVASWAVQMLLILGRGTLSPLLYFVIQLVAFMAQFYAVYQVQLAVNRIAQDPFGRANVRLTMTNLLWVLFGTFLWADAILETYMRQTGRLPESQLEQPVEKLQPAPTAEIY